ncbi:MULTISPECIES: hypothetical protein [Streptomyces]|uniref:hypothetical protein n=1 Tax=Streptomyces TaxID=1883 RepID=UPI000FFE7900|nr:MULTISPECIES: hypothetical protein [Streptomyces]
MRKLLAWLVELLLHGRRRRRPPYPSYSCPYVGGATTYHRGQAPLRGEDSRLVRPYLDLVEIYA